MSSKIYGNGNSGKKILKRILKLKIRSTQKDYFMDNKSLNKHIETLKKKVFFTNTKWPHFEILFNDLTKLSKIKKYKTIVSLERGSLYGNISLFAPLFKKILFL